MRPVRWCVARSTIEIAAAFAAGANMVRREVGPLYMKVVPL